MRRKTHQGLSPKQQDLIQKRLAADAPPKIFIYALWLFLGLGGGHRFYFRYFITGGMMAALLALGLIALASGIFFGGTPLDDVFFKPDLDDILRSAQSPRPYGLYLFYSGAALLAALLLWWLIDGFFIHYFINKSIARNEADLVAFFRKY